jgi:hypothetical protein
VILQLHVFICNWTWAFKPDCRNWIWIPQLVEACRNSCWLGNLDTAAALIGLAGVSLLEQAFWDIIVEAGLAPEAKSLGLALACWLEFGLKVDLFGLSRSIEWFVTASFQIRGTIVQNVFSSPKIEVRKRDNGQIVHSYSIHPKCGRNQGK